MPGRPRPDLPAAAKCGGMGRSAQRAGVRAAISAIANHFADETRRCSNVKNSGSRGSPASVCVAGARQLRTELLDRISPERRSRNMSRIRSRDTDPELKVRRLLHGLGYRFRLHNRKLPGTPDIVLAGRRAVIFVHGCFWHRHGGCARASEPRSRIDFWSQKFEATMLRDSRALEALERDGWRTLVVWECEIGDGETLSGRLVEFLEGGDSNG